MPADESTCMASYSLPVPPGSMGRLSAKPSRQVLPEPLLRNSAAWFCRLRWLVVGVLTVLWLLGNWPPALQLVGIGPLGYWPLLCAVLLTAANGIFLLHALQIQKFHGGKRVHRNLWAQIVVDLLILTVVVHFVGSTTTFIAFAYLFHIVLACLFFPRRMSLLVTLLAAGLFALCVGMEQIGLLSPQTVFPASQRASGPVVVFDVLSALLIWMSVWYLASHLAALVVERDMALAEANRRLLAAQEERARHMLVTTHQLKSPFAAIYANAQLLVGGFCGPLTQEAMTVAQRMVARCRRLAREIQEMLQLANLNSNSLQAAKLKQIDLAEIIRFCLAELQPISQQHGYKLVLDVQEVRLAGVEDHLKMLIGNLLSNAMSYSHPGGRISVSCKKGTNDTACISVADEGIGIAQEKLVHIFDEYYRTNEAVRHNSESSGLGLSIVKEIALRHGIAVRVESGPGVGTTFHLTVPCSAGKVAN